MTTKPKHSKMTLNPDGPPRQMVRVSKQFEPHLQAYITTTEMVPDDLPSTEKVSMRREPTFPLPPKPIVNPKGELRPGALFVNVNLYRIWCTTYGETRVVGRSGLRPTIAVRLAKWSVEHGWMDAGWTIPSDYRLDRPYADDDRKALMDARAKLRKQAKVAANRRVDQELLVKALKPLIGPKGATSIVAAVDGSGFVSLTPAGVRKLIRSVKP